MRRPHLRLPRRLGAPASAGVALLLLATLAVVPAASAASHQVAVRDNFFDPAELTIQAGDTVTWTNLGNNAHNVVADDGSFRCADGCNSTGGDGSVQTGDWSFTLTFDEVGDVPYYCNLHGAPGGIGMAGTVIVEGSDGNPGTLRFVTSSAAVDENAGPGRLRITREGGDDGAVSIDYASSDGSATAGVDYQAVSGTVGWADGEDGPKTFDVPVFDDSEVEGDETVNLALSNPGGGATLGSPSNATLTLRDDDQDTGGDAGTLAFAAAEAGASESAAEISLDVTRSGGASGTVSADVATGDGSATAGSDYQAVATSVTFGDGETGPVPVAVPLLDDDEIEGNETLNLSLSNPTGGASLGDPSAATLMIQDDDVPTGPCEPDATTLCLNDDRFQVQVRFRDPNEPEAGLQLAETVALEGVDSSGLFYFFNRRNIEMLVKVLDACVDALGNQWYVFFAATTNVEFNVTVVDTEAGALKRYSNEQGQAAEPVQDTSAFDTCP